MRLARARKAAAQRAAEATARQQPSVPNAQTTGAQNGFGFSPAGAFSSAPFGSTFNAGGATNRR